jgi:hypothetical protein
MDTTNPTNTIIKIGASITVAYITMHMKKHSQRKRN